MAPPDDGPKKSSPWALKGLGGGLARQGSGPLPPSPEEEARAKSDAQAQAEAVRRAQVRAAYLASGAEEAEALSESLGAKSLEEGEPEAAILPSADGQGFAFKLSQKPKPHGLGDGLRPLGARPSPRPFCRHETDPKALEALRVQLAEAETRLTWLHGPERLAALGTAGNARRMLGDHKTAERWLEEAVTLAHEANHGLAWALNMVRLATAVQFQDRHSEALSLFHQVVGLTESPGVPESVAMVAHFARQHRGKCLAEIGDTLAARADFEAALALRQAKGDPELIASTEEALQALEGWVPW